MFFWIRYLQFTIELFWHFGLEGDVSKVWRINFIEFCILMVAVVGAV